MTRNPFHLVEFSPWPLTGSMSALFLTLGMSSWFHNYGTSLIFFSFVLMTLTMFQWWRDIIRESTFQGLHTLKVSLGLRWGMVLFIVSEICFFFAFFWAYFHSSLAPTMEIGACWPPMYISPLNPFQIPLLNTAILLSSGITVTWAHHSLMNSNLIQAIQAMIMTIILGFYFTILQAMEYNETSFSISDSVYGSTFFVSTGFHGLHVIIGTLFLLTSLIRIIMNHFSSSHHFGFEAAAWYWHFVDVVWLFLYTCIYWWGS
uniref:Cytochrome c oxidase subunit 3 n=1 Tax=Opisthoteuthis californiana TaxID=167140 RepID=A0A9E9FUQ9_9MOLL|nr:cytochrome c oxidase subunit III [Opisthoteuthis californiana]WAP91383.1 cytochrome c oxidase subunit III [Opisthoteuthis californiana]